MSGIVQKQFGIFGVFPNELALDNTSPLNASLPYYDVYFRPFDIDSKDRAKKSPAHSTNPLQNNKQILFVARYAIDADTTATIGGKTDGKGSKAKCVCNALSTKVQTQIHALIYGL